MPWKRIVVVSVNDTISNDPQLPNRLAKKKLVPPQLSRLPRRESSTAFPTKHPPWHPPTIQRNPLPAINATIWILPIAMWVSSTVTTCSRPHLLPRVLWNSNNKKKPRSTAMMNRNHNNPVFPFRRRTCRHENSPDIGKKKKKNFFSHSTRVMTIVTIENIKSNESRKQLPIYRNDAFERLTSIKGRTCLVDSGSSNGIPITSKRD